jgi:predicted AAA+ superfamily ATPase
VKIKWVIFRQAYHTLKSRLDQEDRRFIQVLVGPRQVGKSTIIEQYLSQTKFQFVSSSADDAHVADQVWVEKQWNAARQKCQIHGNCLLIIDEIQNIFEWSSKVKSLWDEDTRKRNNVKVVLLGSSRLLIQKGLTESLAGRFERIYVGHWSFSEIYNAFGLKEEQYAWYGSYPGSIPLISDYNRWKSYIQSSIIDSVIKKDILQLTRVLKPSLLENLFYLGCQYSGQILSFNKIVGQLQDAGNTTTLTHYLSLLESSGMLAGIEKYSGGYLNRRHSSPKLMVQNTAFIGCTAKYSFDEIRMIPDQWGRVVESCVGAHFINFSHQSDYKVYYWRENNDEVDFVLENRGKCIGIEVKSTNKRATKGMSVFVKQFSPDKVYEIADNTISWKEILKIDPITLF